VKSKTLSLKNHYRKTHTFLLLQVAIFIELVAKQLMEKDHVYSKANYHFFIQ